MTICNCASLSLWHRLLQFTICKMHTIFCHKADVKKFSNKNSKYIAHQTNSSAFIFKSAKRASSFPYVHQTHTKRLILAAHTYYKICCPKWSNARRRERSTVFHIQSIKFVVQCKSGMMSSWVFYWTCPSTDLLKRTSIANKTPRHTCTVRTETPDHAIVTPVSHWVPGFPLALRISAVIPHKPGALPFFSFRTAAWTWDSDGSKIHGDLHVHYIENQGKACPDFLCNAHGDRQDTGGWFSNCSK